MKLTKNKLRDRRIFNAYDLAELQDEPKAWVEFTSSDSRSSSWRVHRLGWHTAGQNGGSKTFINHGRSDKEAKRLEALAWATERYVIQEWERSPFGTYHPVGTLARAEEKNVKP